MKKLRKGDSLYFTGVLADAAQTTDWGKVSVVAELRLNNEYQSVFYRIPSMTLDPATGAYFVDVDPDITKNFPIGPAFVTVRFELEDGFAKSAEPAHFLIIE